MENRGKVLQGGGGVEGVPLLLRNHLQDEGLQRPEGFSRKWGVTAGTFTREYLRRGQTWDGPLKEPEPGLAARIVRAVLRR